MKHALELESKARFRAEMQFLQEQQLRVDLEHKMEALQAENAALQAEKRSQLGTAIKVLLPLEYPDFPPLHTASDNPVQLTETEGFPSGEHLLAVESGLQIAMQT